MEDGVTFDIIDHVDRWSGRYPESLIKILYDLAEKAKVGGLEDVVTFDFIDHVCRWSGTYPESLMKIRHDLAEKKFVPGSGRVGWLGGWFSLSLRIGLSRSIWECPNS